MNKSQMEEESKNMESTFFTQIKERRPTTSYITRNKTQLQHQLSLDPEIDPSQKLKIYKEQIKKLENEYQSALTRLNQSKKVIDKNYRDSQKKKVQFLNLYENRKLKLVQQKLLQNKQQEEQRCRLQLKEKAKTMKLNSEIRSLLIRNEMEENNSQLCLKNKRDKRSLKQKIVHKRELDFEQARKSFSKIKASQNELQVRRKRIEEIQMAVAKQNYFKKVEKELRFIEDIDQQINLTFDNSAVCNNCIDAKSFFITDKID